MLLRIPPEKVQERVNDWCDHVNEEKEEGEPDDDKAPLVLSRKRLQKPAVKDLTPRARPAGDAPAPPPKKPTRLIQ